RSSEGTMSERGNGITRRAFVRRTAVVGGSLLWIAPAIQTLAPAARAHTVGTPAFGCCMCLAPGNLNPAQCYANVATQADCDALCAPANLITDFHAGPSPFSCVGKRCVSTEHPAGP
ncbi:MAG TPA: hypothetical protein VNO79_04235, partial [Actinomycetota bacterium]|nr:hypothetical protein [Actinomycetota bacterium]